jgi:hypothetical protein
LLATDMKPQQASTIVSSLVHATKPFAHRRTPQS